MAVLVRTFGYFCLILILLIGTSACTMDYNLTSLESPSVIEDTTPSIDETLTVYVGASTQIAPTGGVPPFTFKPSTSGYLDTDTGEYAVPPGAAVESEVVEVTDSAGQSFRIKVRRRGFKDVREIEMPQAAGQDQNYVTDAVWLDDGTVLATAIGSDNMGERWATYRSTDNGLNWSRTDQFMGRHYYGESHPLAMDGHNNMVFVCGYAYTYSEGRQPGDAWEFWYIRRSLDGGLTWNTSDEWWTTENAEYNCVDIAISRSTGYIYATGWAFLDGQNKAVIKESRDLGNSWQLIYAEAIGGSIGWPAQISVKPNGDLLIIESEAGTGKVRSRKMHHDGTQWLTEVSAALAYSVGGGYQTNGTLVVVSDSVAYYAHTNVSTGSVLKTTDGGTTWTQKYTGLAFLQGLTVASDGTVIAAGGRDYGADYQWRVVRSTDLGETWNVIDLEALFAPGAKNYGVAITSHPSDGRVSSISFYESAMTAYSSDHGASWSLSGEIRFQWAFWGEITKMIKTAAGNFIAIVSTGDMFGTWPWLVQKSTDALNWSDSDRFTDANDSTWTIDLTVGHDGALYVSGYSMGNLIIRRSSDEGTSWSEVFSTGAFTGGWDFFVNHGTQSTLLIRSQSNVIYIYETTNGTTWNLKNSLPLQMGVTGQSLRQVQPDESGNIYVLTTEIPTATVVRKSTDGGATWSEIFRLASDTISNMKVKNEQDIYVFGTELKKTSNGGTTWEAQTSPPGAIRDIEFDGSRLLYLTEVSWSGKIMIDGETPGTFLEMDSETVREEANFPVGKYEYAIYDKMFNSGALTGPYLRWSYNDPYLGARVVIMELTTSD